MFMGSGSHRVHSFTPLLKGMFHANTSGGFSKAYSGERAVYTALFELCTVLLRTPSARPGALSIDGLRLPKISFGLHVAAGA